jgi:hypothetical protein
MELKFYGNVLGGIQHAIRTAIGQANSYPRDAGKLVIVL